MISMLSATAAAALWNYSSYVGMCEMVVVDLLEAIAAGGTDRPTERVY
jgi:hypothetical protein